MAGCVDHEKGASNEEDAGVKLSFRNRLEASFTETPCISRCFGT